MRINDVPPYRRQINTVFQKYALFPHMNVFENVAFGLKLQKLPKAEIRERVENMLSLVKLVGLDRRYPRELSGGQQQRVAIARAVVTEPCVILADEPTAGLDPAAADSVLELFDRLHRSGHTLVLITHDERAAQCAARRMYLGNGCIFG